jgi:hypothetical protein
MVASSLRVAPAEDSHDQEPTVEPASKPTPAPALAAGTLSLEIRDMSEVLQRKISP